VGLEDVGLAHLPQVIENRELELTESRKLAARPGGHPRTVRQMAPSVNRTLGASDVPSFRRMRFDDGDGSLAQRALPAPTDDEVEAVAISIVGAVLRLVARADDRAALEATTNPRCSRRWPRPPAPRRPPHAHTTTVAATMRAPGASDAPP
jgi:hypothetical protein